MAKESNETYLGHMFEAIEKIERNIAKRSYKSFVADEVLVGFVTYELAIIGEAANKLTDEFHEEHKVMPWSKMIGMRNWIIHGYFNVNPETLWQTTKDDLPELKKYIEKLV